LRSCDSEPETAGFGVKKRGCARSFLLAISTVRFARRWSCPRISIELQAETLR
jgi:hypothetical protein